MNVIQFLNFYFLFTLAFSTGEQNFVNNMINSILDYYECRSVIFVVSDNQISGKYINLLKDFNSKESFYYISCMNFATFSKAVRHGCHGGKKTVVVLESNEQFLNGSLEALSHEVDISSYKWLGLSSTNDLKNFERLRIPITTEFIVASENLEGYTLTEIYEVETGRKLKRLLGHWFPGSLKISSKKLFQRRKNLQKAVIKVISPSEDPCREASFVSNIASIVLCIHIILWYTTAEMLNVTTEIIVMPDLDKNTIEKINADLTLRSAPMNTRDLATRSYIWPVFGTKLEVLASYIGQEIEWQTYIRPFSQGMWLVIFFWILIGDIIMAFSEFFAYLLNKKVKKDKPFFNYYNTYYFLSVFAFCNQGVSEVPKLYSGRLIFFLMFAIPTILSPAYSAVLTSFITVQLPKMPFRNLEELSREKKYDLGWHSSFPFHMMFNRNDTRPLSRALLSNNVLPEEKMPDTDAEAVKKMCDEKFTFISNINTIIALKPKCKYFKLDHHFLKVFTSIEVKKNNSYGYFFNRCVRDIQLNGVFSRIAVKTVMKFIRPSDLIVEHTDEVSPIMMENCVLPFTVLLFSAGLSGFIFVLEKFCFKLNKLKPSYVLTK